MSTATISVTCPGCQRTLRTPDEYLGKTVRCPACQTAFTVPSPVSTLPPPIQHHPVHNGHPSRITATSTSRGNQVTRQQHLLAFGIVGTIVALLLIFLALTLPKNATPVTHTQQHASRSAAIDPASLESTISEVNNLARQLAAAAKKSGNAFQMQELEDKLLRDYRALQGKEVAWDFPVEAVTDRVVILKNTFDHLRFVRRIPNHTPRVTFSGKPAPPYDQDENLQLPIGQAISVEQARQLRTGDRLTVHGTVDAVSAFGTLQPFGGITAYEFTVALMQPTAHR